VLVGLHLNPPNLLGVIGQSQELLFDVTYRKLKYAGKLFKREEQSQFLQQLKALLLLCEHPS